MKVIIVDDEPLALDILETFIEKMPDLELVARCTNAFEANQILKEQTVDLMLLDIQMPQLNGIDFLKSLTKPPITIYTTAHPDFAVQGFELNACDYLMKPISLDRFMKSINKARDIFEREHKTALNSPVEDANTEYMFVKADKKLVRIKFSDVLYIEGLKDYVIIRTESEKIISLQTMKSLEEKLPSSKFVQIHRSFIVGIDKIKAIDGNSVEVTEKGQPKLLPIGKNHKDEVLEIIEKHKL